MLPDAQQISVNAQVTSHHWRADRTGAAWENFIPWIRIHMFKLRVNMCLHVLTFYPHPLKALAGLCLKQTLHACQLSLCSDSVSLLIKCNTTTVLNLPVKHIECLEIKVAFSVSSKSYVIILWPLLFLRFFCLLSLQTQPEP